MGQRYLLLVPERDVIVKLTFIPSSVTSTAQEPLLYLTSCLCNDSVVIDAGSIGFWRTPIEQARIRHVLLTHTHMDHVASLPIFVENAYEGRSQGVTIHGSTPVLDSCQRDIFNDRIWPDFVALSRGDKPFVHLAPFEPGQTRELEGLRFTAIELNHVVPTVGYLISDAQASVAFVTDTGPTDEIWQHANARPDLKAVFLEITFPNAMSWLADVSKHLTAATFAQEVGKLTRPVRIIVTHIKPRYRQEVMAELRALNLPQVEVVCPGSTYEF
jgi:ribonuclease BN (tRNA processing enzyme)